MQVPSNLALNYMGRPSLYLGFFTTAWGLVSCLTSQVKNYGGIVACRFILGLVEAPFFAGVLFYLSKWYTKSELNLRMSIFYSGSLISGAFGSLIAAGILSGLNGSLGMSAWQWLYIIEGSITMFVGLVIMVILPDFPDTWRFLSPEMKHVGKLRIKAHPRRIGTNIFQLTDVWRLMLQRLTSMTAQSRPKSRVSSSPSPISKHIFWR